jgi:hypothetical protein
MKVTVLAASVHSLAGAFDTIMTVLANYVMASEFGNTILFVGVRG